MAHGPNLSTQDLHEFEASLAYSELQHSQEYIKRPCLETKPTCHGPWTRAGPTGEGEISSKAGRGSLGSVLLRKGPGED